MPLCNRRPWFIKQTVADLRAELRKTVERVNELIWTIQQIEHSFPEDNPLTADDIIAAMRNGHRRKSELMRVLWLTDAELKTVMTPELGFRQLGGGIWTHKSLSAPPQEKSDGP